jgi:two-component system, NtrC family, nitrogen regulation sensor histidine kinase NtrY
MRPYLGGSLGSRLATALLLTAALPFGASLFLVGRLADEPLSIGLNPQVVASLDDLAGLYPELFRVRRALAEARADALAFDPALAGADEAALRAHLIGICDGDPHLRQIGLGATSVVCDAPHAAEVEAPLELMRETAGGEPLRLVFGLDEALLESHREAAELAGIYASLAAQRGAIGTAYRRAFLALLGGWALLAGIAGFLLARRTAARLTMLAEATHRVSAGDLSVRVDVGGRDELADLARAFNEMVDELAARGERIVYLEKISSWQEIARRLAHEIKNPLTPIQLAMQQLESRWQKGGSDDPHFGRLLSESVEIVREEVETLGRLVGEFSAFARLPDVSPEPTDLCAFVREFVRSHPDLAEAAAIAYTGPDAPVPAGVDRGMMRRVLVNLVQNAIDAAEDAGAIPRVRLEVSLDVRGASIRVADEGPGMPKEVLRRIFDPYFTTKETGTGLGLAICKKIVLQHGGTLGATSEAGQGTVFEIRLPAGDGASAGDPVGSAA